MAQEGVNVIFKSGQTLGKYLINGGPPRNDRRKNVIKFPVQPAIFATLEKCHNGLMREQASTNVA